MINLLELGSLYLRMIESEWVGGANFLKKPEYCLICGFPS